MSADLDFSLKLAFGSSDLCADPEGEHKGDGQGDLHPSIAFCPATEDVSYSLSVYCMN